MRCLIMKEMIHKENYRQYIIYFCDSEMASVSALLAERVCRKTLHVFYPEIKFCTEIARVIWKFVFTNFSLH